MRVYNTRTLMDVAKPHHCGCQCDDCIEWEMEHSDEPSDPNRFSEDGKDYIWDDEAKLWRREQ